MSLKYGAKLVWGPEIVDKAILHAKRVVDRTCIDNVQEPALTLS